jgi:hypothetical protein
MARKGSGLKSPSVPLSITAGQTHCAAIPSLPAELVPALCVSTSPRGLVPVNVRAHGASWTPSIERFVRPRR